MLGIREPEIYGRQTYEDLVATVRAKAGELGCEADFFQSNHEGDIVDAIQGAYGKYDGIIINPVLCLRPGSFWRTVVMTPTGSVMPCSPEVLRLASLPERTERGPSVTIKICINSGISLRSCLAGSRIGRITMRYDRCAHTFFSALCLAASLIFYLDVFVWKYLIAPLGGIFAIYELLPAFIVASLVIVIVSLITEAPSKEIIAEFEQVDRDLSD